MSCTPPPAVSSPYTEGMTRRVIAGITGSTLLAMAALFACGERFPEETKETPLPDASIDSASPTSDAAIDSSAPDSSDAGADASIDSDARDDDASDANADADASIDASLDGESDADADAGDAANCPQSPLTTTDAGGACNVVVQSFANEGNTHIAEGSPTVYCTEPPSSGNHYPVWANYVTYTKPVADGYLVHSLEHGAIVIRYQCASSCPTVAADLQAVIDAHPLDPMCDGTIKSRLILVPDPNLNVPVAASAWTWTYRATCVDAPSLTAFINAHYAQATENTCAAGVTPP